MGNNRAYNVGGNRGVELGLKDDRIVITGSQKAEELVETIQKDRETRSGGN